jgi:hypothetical protein
MFLVGVHSQVSAAAAPLLERTLNALVESVAEEALRCFRQVKKFGMGGMLRVSLIYITCRLDLTFLHRRQRWKSSSCTRRWLATSRPRRQRRSRSCTTRSRRPMLVNPATRISRRTWTASRRLLPRRGVRQASSSCASGKRRPRRSRPLVQPRRGPRIETVMGPSSERGEEARMTQLRYYNAQDGSMIGEPIPNLLNDVSCNFSNRILGRSCLLQSETLWRHERTQ